MTKEELTIRINRGESFLLANDGEYIGKLCTNKYDIESICNIYGIYGSKYGVKSIWNQYGRYGSPYSIVSPNNPYSLSPPIIFLRGSQYGYLTCNDYKHGTIVNPSNLQQWMLQNSL